MQANVDGGQCMNSSYILLQLEFGVCMFVPQLLGDLWAYGHQMSWNVFQFNMVTFDDMYGWESGWESTGESQGGNPIGKALVIFMTENPP